LRLAGVAGNSYSLVEMQSRAFANDLAFIEYDLALIDIDHGPQLVVEELPPPMFDVFRKPDPVADRERDLLRREHAEFLRLVQRQLFFNPILCNNYDCFFSSEYFPLFATLKAFLFDSFPHSSLGDSMELDDLPWRISDRIPLLRLSQIQPL